MLKLTHKAISRMSGYRITEEYHHVHGKMVVENFNKQYQWNDTDNDDTGIFWYDTEQEAWEACCVENELIEEN